MLLASLPKDIDTPKSQLRHNCASRLSSALPREITHLARIRGRRRCAENQTRNFEPQESGYPNAYPRVVSRKFEFQLRRMNPVVSVCIIGKNLA